MLSIDGRDIEGLGIGGHVIGWHGFYGCGKIGRGFDRLGNWHVFGGHGIGGCGNSGRGIDMLCIDGIDIEGRAIGGHAIGYGFDGCGKIGRGCDRLGNGHVFSGRGIDGRGYINNWHNI